MELRKNPPDILQALHIYTNLYVVATARMLGLFEVGAIRTDGLREINELGVAGQLSLKTPRVIAVNSRAALRNATEMGVPHTRLCFLPNVVDTDKFKPETRKDNSPIRLIAVGRLVEQKRFDRFLNIIARVQKQTSRKIKAIIVGDGPLRGSLEKKVAALRLLPEVVEFAGLVPDMGPIYQKAHILVLTSAWEGTPNVLLEAMASGLAVVATRVGGVPEIIQQGDTGYLTDPDDESSMTTPLLELIANRSLRMELGSRARQYVVANHSLTRLPGFLKELYGVALE